MLFDFARWRSWTEAKGRDMKAKAPTVEFARNEEFLPGFGLGLVSNTALGSFRCYSNGLVDFEVIDTRSNTLVANEAMIEVSDSNFEATFDSFMSEFEKVN